VHKAAFFAAAFAAVCHVSNPAQAGPREDLETMAGAFDEMALRVHDREPATLVRWSMPIRFRIVNDGAPPGLESEARRAIVDAAGLGRIPAREARPADPQANFTVRLENSTAAPRQPCVTDMRSAGGGMTQVDIVVNVNRFRGVGYCIVHEVMHGFGFRSHARTIDSVLKPHAVRLDYTPADRLLIRTLYDRRLGNDMDPVTASRIACGILAESLGVARGEADPVCAQRSGTGSGRVSRR
jgi:hypothetical protein